MNNRKLINNFIDYFKIQDNLSFENELRYINNTKKFNKFLKKLISYFLSFIIIISLFAVSIPYLGFILGLEEALKNNFLTGTGNLIVKSSVIVIIAAIVPILCSLIVILILIGSLIPFWYLLKYINRLHYNFVPKNMYQRKRYWNITSKYSSKSFNLLYIWGIIVLFSFFVYIFKNVGTENSFNIYLSARIGIAILIATFVIMYFINTSYRIKYLYSIKRLKILIIRNTIMDVIDFITFLLFLTLIANFSNPLIIKSSNYIPYKAMNYINKLDNEIIEEYTKLTINKDYKNKISAKYKDGIFKDYKELFDWGYNLNKYKQNISIITNYIPILIFVYKK